MEENLKNKFGLITFCLIILFLLVGGYFFTNYTINNMHSDKDKVVKQKDYKIDKDKDYIYFINDEIISEDAEIYYKDVVINLETQKSLTDTLKKENDIYKNNIKYLSDVDYLTEDLIKYNNDNLYALTFRDYKTYEYNNYISLLINDYNYDCFEEITFNKTKSYIFNIKTGKVLSEEEILDKYNITLDEIKQLIKDHLSNMQTEEGIIKIDETINKFDNYAFYINNYGRLFISYLVKTNEVNYNEDMEVNL